MNLFHLSARGAIQHSPVSARNSCRPPSARCLCLTPVWMCCGARLAERGSYGWASCAPWAWSSYLHWRAASSKRIRGGTYSLPSPPVPASREICSADSPKGSSTLFSPRNLQIFSAFDAVAVTNQDIVLIVPRGHPLAKRHSVDLADTPPYPHVFFRMAPVCAPLRTSSSSASARNRK